MTTKKEQNLKHKKRVRKRYIINGESPLSELIGDLRELFKAHKFFTVTINTGKKRTLQQNSISHVWYSKIYKEEREYLPDGVKRLCKYHFGLPILRAEDEHMNDVCCRIIDPLSYEDRILAMEYLPVTSLMDTQQLSMYLEQMQQHYAGRVRLEFPKDYDRYGNE